jgi:flagellar biosynthesis protein FlhF
MRIKRYIVDSMPDALQKIRSDLGKDAIILNTKQVRHGGFLGLFGKKKFEVIAAIDPNASASPGAFKTKTAGPELLGHRHESHLTSHSDAGMQSASIAVLEEKRPAETELKESLVKLTDGELVQEIMKMRDLVYKMAAHQGAVQELPEALQSFQCRLEKHEISPILIQEWMKDVIEKSNDSGLTAEKANMMLKSEMKKTIKSDATGSLSPDTKLVHFVGPTGVGKTTTIAKLAAEQVLKHQRKVGFITSDTYRISAVEQLKTYATILNVPLEVVVSPSDLKKALTNLKDRDIIFMDTAGRNYRNELFVSELHSLLASGEKSETYLVLSLTMKYKDMKQITENFSKFKLDKVLFTKRDETDTFGSVFNLLHDFPLTCSYITDGQNVPDDINEFKADYFIDLILEESKDE